MKKVLIVEDDAFLQGLEVSKLEKEGYKVVTASSGEEALKKINDPEISIVLLDLVLPNYDGLDVLKKIRNSDELKDVPVIVFSNLSEEKTINKAKELGANEFMVKSNFTLDELLKKIKSSVK